MGWGWVLGGGGQKGRAFRTDAGNCPAIIFFLNSFLYNVVNPCKYGKAAQAVWFDSKKKCAKFKKVMIKHIVSVPRCSCCYVKHVHPLLSALHTLFTTAKSLDETEAPAALPCRDRPKHNSKRKKLKPTLGRLLACLSNMWRWEQSEKTHSHRDSFHPFLFDFCLQLFPIMLCPLCRE